MYRIISLSQFLIQGIKQPFLIQNKNFCIWSLYWIITVLNCANRMRSLWLSLLYKIGSTEASSKGSWPGYKHLHMNKGKDGALHGLDCQSLILVVNVPRDSRRSPAVCGTKRSHFTRKLKSRNIQRAVVSVLEQPLDLFLRQSHAV